MPAPMLLPGKGPGRFRPSPRSTFVGITEDGSSPLAVASTGAATSPPLTTAKFSPPAGSLLVAMYAVEKGSGFNDVLSDTGPNKWTFPSFIYGGTANGGEAVVAYQYLTTAPGPMSVSLTVSGGGTGRLLAVKVLNGCSPYQTGGAITFSSASGLVGYGAVNFITADVGSVVYGISNNPDTGSGFNLLTGTTPFAVHNNATDSVCAAAWRSNAPTGGYAAGVKTYGVVQAGASANTNIAVLEILPAYTYTTEGLPNAGVTAHYQWRYDRNLIAAGIEPARTIDAMANCEADYAQMVSWFGFDPNLSLPVVVANISDGAHWSDTTSPVTLYSRIYYGPNAYQSVTSGDYLRYLLASEVVEMFQYFQAGGNGWFYNGQDEGVNGEALSRFLGTQLLLTNGLTVGGQRDTLLAAYSLVPSWLNSARADQINAANVSNPGVTAATGGACAYLWWLYSQLGYPVSQICRGAGNTLRANYQSVTGRTEDPFPVLNAMLGRVFPAQSGNTAASVNSTNPDNPFPQPAPLISQVGTVAASTNSGGGTTHTVSVSPTQVGNLLVLGLRRASTSVTVSSVTGGGVTSWTHLAGPFADGTTAHSLDLYIGTVTTPGASTITVTYSGSLTANAAGAAVQEFTSFYGTNAVWSLDGSQTGSLSNSSSTTVTFPSLTPAAAGELYVGYSWVSNTGAAGSTSGYTYQLDTGNNPFVYDPDVSTSAQAPTAAQNTAGTSSSLAALIKVSGAAQADYGVTAGQAVMRACTY